LSTSRSPDQSDAAALEAWLERLETLHPKKIDLSLERVITVLDALRLRTPAYRVLTIGGTNGKGSCVATLDALYARAGYRVGAYISPHLWRFNERIRVAGSEASDAELMALFEEIDAARGATSLSYFEFTTIAACLHFARQEVDVALLEVGLGGRLDAVNAIEPDLALVSSIAMDHEHWLGTTRDAIGREKAGIFRAMRPAIVGDPPPSLLEHAASIGADLWHRGVDFDIVRDDDGRWAYRGREWVCDDLPPPALRGDAQYWNAASCVAALEATQDILPVAHDQIRTGIGAVRLRARLETHVLDGVSWVFDVAHNPAAAATLSAALDQDRDMPTIAVVGMMADKKAAAILAALAPHVDEWIVTRARSERGADPDALVEVLRDLSAGRVSAAATPEAACAAARARAMPGDRVVVFGSFQIVGPVMAALELYSEASSSGNTSAKWTGV
jgi:dihydrofolate synthase/folylpolyglutamate synthase